MGLEYITEPQIFLSSLSALGDHFQIDSTVSITSAVDITNSGNKIALSVNQNSNHPIAEFLDDGNTVLFIDGRVTSPRRVGINTRNPNHALTVNGNISASGTVFIGGGLNSNSLFLNNPTGDTRIEVGGNAGVYIDLKNPNTDDYDLRIGTNSTDSFIHTKTGQPLYFSTGNVYYNSGNVYYNSGNFAIGDIIPNEKLTVSGNISSSEIVYGFFSPRTSSILVNTDTITLPYGTNDVELSSVSHRVVINFLNGVYGVTYTLTNLSNTVITISSSPTVMVRDGLGLNWMAHSCTSTSNSVQLLKNAACSVRIGSGGFASVW